MSARGKIKEDGPLDVTRVRWWSDRRTHKTWEGNQSDPRGERERSPPQRVAHGEWEWDPGAHFMGQAGFMKGS